MVEAVQFKTGVFFLGDCFDVMATLPAGMVDMVLCDLPYETTNNRWDQALPFDRMWSEYWRLLKPTAPAVLTAQQPFTSALVMSQLDQFRYDWTWEKTAATGFLNAKKAPLKAHEDVLVFCRKAPPYNPQKTQGHVIKRVNASYAAHGTNYGKSNSVRAPYESKERYPRSVVLFPKDNRIGRPHPTQKPVALFEYLIRTYTNPGELVLDNTAGSGTTAVAAIQSGRSWICIERDPEYFAKACVRVAEAEALTPANP